MFDVPSPLPHCRAGQEPPVGRAGHSEVALPQTRPQPGALAELPVPQIPGFKGKQRAQNEATHHHLLSLTL